MAGTNLSPEKINSPFQLMAAWFAMLVLLVSALLTGAAKIDRPEWASGFLIIFTAVLILIVLACVTLMLTKFRPHLQEGKEYSQWLKDQNTYSSPEKIENIAKPKFIAGITQSKKEVKPTQLLQSMNKNFLINVNNLDRSKDLCRSLNEHGFNANIYDAEIQTGESLDECEAIWVGAMLPAKEVVEAIKIAIQTWPHLKYLHLSNDGSVPPDEIHHQLFLGGSSNSAREFFKLTAWTTKELSSLKGNMTSEELHTLIRRKYQR